MKRYLMIYVTRTAGTEGDVTVTFDLEYNDVSISDVTQLKLVLIAQMNRKYLFNMVSVLAQRISLILLAKGTDFKSRD